MPNKKNFDLDVALTKLEEINELISGDDITLEKALKLYQEGTLLAKECEKHLVKVEKELETIEKES